MTRQLRLIGLIITMTGAGLISAMASQMTNKIAIVGWGSLIWNPGTLEIAATGNRDHPERNWKADGPVLPIAFSRVSRDGRLTLVIDPKSKINRETGVERRSRNIGGNDVTTLYTESKYKINELNKAIKNLKEREGVRRTILRSEIHPVGYINLSPGQMSFRITQVKPKGAVQDDRSIKTELKRIEGKIHSLSTNPSNIKLVAGSGIRDELKSYLKNIIAWAYKKGYKAVIWTDFQSNFHEKNVENGWNLVTDSAVNAATGNDGKWFTIKNAKTYLNSLSAAARRVADEYIDKAPVKDQTKLGQALS